MPLPLNVHFLTALRQLTPSLEAGGLYGLLVTGLFALYGWLYWLVRRGDWHPRPWTLLLTAILVSLPTLFVYPYNANDLFRYALRGRITAVYQDNPYLTPPASYPSEPLLAQAGEWAQATTPYGPVWELIAAGIATVAPNDTLILLILLKLVALLAFWLSGLLIWYAASVNKLGKSVLWLFNPGLILIFGVDGHNDSVMLLWLLAGWAVWVWLGERWPSVAATAAFALMFLAPLTKAIGLLPLAFFWLYFVRQQDDTHGRVRVILSTAVLSLLLTLLTFAPFGSPLLLAERLVAEASAGAGFSIVALIFLAGSAAGYGITPTFVALLSRGGLALLVLTALWLAWRSWFYGRHPLRSGADITAVYLTQAFNFRLWYAAWPFPFVLLDETPGWVTRWRLHTAVWFLYLSQLSPLIVGHLWLYLFDRNHLTSHALVVAVMFGLSPLLAYFSSSVAIRGVNVEN